MIKHKKAQNYNEHKLSSPASPEVPCLFLKQGGQIFKNTTYSVCHMGGSGGTGVQAGLASIEEQNEVESISDVLYWSSASWEQEEFGSFF